MLRVGGAYVHNGVFMLAYARGESAVWLHDFDDVVTRRSWPTTEMNARMTASHSWNVFS